MRGNPGLLLAATLLTGLLVLAGGGTIGPAAGKEPQTPRTDAMGDPLPAGAVARLGSNRFRVPGPVKSLAFGPGDRSLVAHGGDEVLVWDARTGKELRRFAVPDGCASALAPGAKTLALIDDKHVRFWDVAAGKELHKAAPPPGPDRYTPGGRAFSHDGTKLAVAGTDRVQIYDPVSGKTLATLNEVEEAWALTFSPDGRWLAFVPHALPLQLWNVASQKHVCDIKAGSDEWFPAAVCFSPDSKTLAWAKPACVGTSAVATGKVLTHFQHEGVPRWLVFTADGRGLISAHEGAGIQLWDLTLKKKKRDLSKERWRRPILALSRDGKTLAAGDNKEDGSRQVRLWDLVGGGEIPAEPGHEQVLNLLAFSADGKTLASGDEHHVLFWDTATGERRRRLECPGHDYPVVSPDLRMSAVIDWRSIKLWDLARGRQTAELKYDGKDFLRFGAISPDGKHLITTHNKIYPRESPQTGLGDNGLCVWDLPGGKIVRRLTTERECTYAGLVLTPDGGSAITSAGDLLEASEGGRTFTTSSNDGGTIYVWDLRAGQEALILQGHKATASRLAVSGDGRLLASASRDHTVRVWELASGMSICTFPLRDVPPLAVSPDGRLLAAACDLKGERRHIGLWDLAAGKQIHRLEGFGAPVSSLAFSPDGRRLVSALHDGTALLWDLGTARQALKRAPAKLRSGDGPRLWDDLSSLDAARAHRAAWTLIDAGDEAVSLLKARLWPARMDPKRMQELLAALDSGKFAAREAAVAELGRLADAAEPALRQALKRGPSLEARRRIEPILEYRRMFVNGPTLARRRAIHVLEKIGSAEARELLRTLAAGDPEVRSTQEAISALKRSE